MALKLIGAGFGRTGTMSTYTALNKLGMPCYHMFEVIDNKENKNHLDFWNKVADAPPRSDHNWEEVFHKYEATIDNPACCVYKELMVAYPDAKVLLTLHPKGPEEWYESTIDTIYFTESMWQFKVLELFTPFGKKMGNMCHKLIWQGNHKGTLRSKEEAVAHYKQYVEEVKAHVPPEKLLIFDVTQGWEPLCQFIGKEVPEGAFPRVNDRNEIKKTIADITKGAYVILTILTLLVIGLVLLALYLTGAL